MANIKSKQKRVITNEKARRRNKSIRSAVRTEIRKFREAAESGDKAAAADAPAEAATTETSSGNRDLDRAARMQVLKAWKFQPAMQDGRAVQAYGRVPVDFSLR